MVSCPGEILIWGRCSQVLDRVGRSKPGGRVASVPKYSRVNKCTVMYPSFEHIITQGLRYIGDGGHVVIFVRERDEVPTSGDRNWDEIYASNHVDYVHR